MHLYADLLIAWYVLAEAFYYVNIYKPVKQRRSYLQRNSILHSCSFVSWIGVIVAFTMLAFSSQIGHLVEMAFGLVLYTLCLREFCRHLAIRRLQRREPRWSRSELLAHIQRRTQLTYAP